MPLAIDVNLELGKSRRTCFVGTLPFSQRNRHFAISAAASFQILSAFGTRNLGPPLANSNRTLRRFPLRVNGEVTALQVDVRLPPKRPIADIKLGPLRR